MDTVGLLKLAFMDLTELSPFTFRGLTNVAVLSLQESDLGVICANSFDGLSHVGTLKFLNNKIDSIEELNLTSSHHIKHLIFHGNHLLETPDPGALILEGIRNISVINNHFPCGCHVHTLLDSPLSNGSYNRGDFLSRNYCISPLDVNGKAMSELDLYAIGRCQEQVTRENLESDAISLHLCNKQHHRIYVYVTAVLLLILINGLQRYECGGNENEDEDNDASGINKYIRQCDSTSNQTEIHHNDIRKIECRQCDRMMLFTESVACRWAYRKKYVYESKIQVIFETHSHSLTHSHIWNMSSEFSTLPFQFSTAAMAQQKKFNSKIK